MSKSLTVGPTVSLSLSLLFSQCGHGCWRHAAHAVVAPLAPWRPSGPHRRHLLPHSPSSRFPLSFPSKDPLSLGLPEPPVAADDDQRIAAVREPVPWIEEELHLRRDLLSLKVEGIDAGSPESPPPLRFSCRRPPPPCKLGNDSGHPDLAARTVALRVRPPSSRTFP